MGLDDGLCSTLQLCSDSKQVRKVLVDNHEVEAGDTGKDLLLLTAV